MKAKCKELEERMISSDESDEHQDNAGYHFGGRKGKKHQKRSDLLIGSLLLHLVKSINYLVNCLFITPRRKTVKIADYGASQGFIQQRGAIFLDF